MLGNNLKMCANQKLMDELWWLKLYYSELLSIKLRLLDVENNLERNKEKNYKHIKDIDNQIEDLNAKIILLEKTILKFKSNLNFQNKNLRFFNGIDSKIDQLKFRIRMHHSRK